MNYILLSTRLLQLYDGFVRFVESKLNQIALQQFVSKTAEQLYPTRPYVDAGGVHAIKRPTCSGCSIMLTCLLCRDRPRY
jgi:hypothetical protein